MKILMISMFSIHFKRWCLQLKDSGHEIHWFDANDGDHIPELYWIHQHRGWRYKGGDFKGRTLLKSKFPGFHKMLENSMPFAFEKILKEVRPDVVHSFVMYKCAAPIFPVMQRFPNIKWVYSSWGSDLYHFKELPEHRDDMEKVLPHIDYLFCDNNRDHGIAVELGFKGTYCGTFPGGGGFHIEKYDAFRRPLDTRRSILIKGYQGRSGRAISVLQALLKLKEELSSWDLIVFGADPEVVEFIDSDEFLRKNIQIASTKKGMLPHEEILKLMGEAKIYIGNSASDGMPNTLLEAIVMGAFPIQSNPGNASAEVIEHGTNGLLIEDAEDPEMISVLISKALGDTDMLNTAFDYNLECRHQFDYDRIQKEVISCYQRIESEL